MSVKRKGKLPTLVVDNNVSNLPSRKEDVSEVKLHVRMDALTFRHIEMLRAALRTSSDQEIFRRALMAYEIFEPEGVYDQEVSKTQNETTNVKSLHRDKYINLSGWMKDLLDEAKENYGKTYTETIRDALMILLQLVKNTRDLREGIESGGTDTRRLIPIAL